MFDLNFKLRNYHQNFGRTGGSGTQREHPGLNGTSLRTPRGESTKPELALQQREENEQRELLSKLESDPTVFDKMRRSIPNLPHFVCNSPRSGRPWGFGNTTSNVTPRTKKQSDGTSGLGQTPRKICIAGINGTGQDSSLSQNQNQSQGTSLNQNHILGKGLQDFNDNNYIKGGDLCHDYANNLNQLESHLNKIIDPYGQSTNLDVCDDIFLGNRRSKFKYVRGVRIEEEITSNHNHNTQHPSKVSNSNKTPRSARGQLAFDDGTGAAGRASGVNARQETGRLVPDYNQMMEERNVDGSGPTLLENEWFWDLIPDHESLKLKDRMHLHEKTNTQHSVDVANEKNNLYNKHIQKKEHKEELENSICRFSAIINDTNTEAYERRFFLISWYLEDDTVEIYETGVDPFPESGLREKPSSYSRQPRVFFRRNKPLSSDTNNLSDFFINSTVTLVANSFFIYDCCPKTRVLYKKYVGKDLGPRTVIDIMLKEKDRFNTNANGRSNNSNTPRNNFKLNSHTATGLDVGEENDNIGQSMSLSKPGQSSRKSGNNLALQGKVLRWTIRMISDTGTEKVKKTVDGYKSDRQICPLGGYGSPMKGSKHDPSLSTPRTYRNLNGNKKASCGDINTVHNNKLNSDIMNNDNNNTADVNVNQNRLFDLLYFLHDGEMKVISRKGNKGSSGQNQLGTDSGSANDSLDGYSAFDKNVFLKKAKYKNSANGNAEYRFFKPIDMFGTEILDLRKIKNTNDNTNQNLNSTGEHTSRLMSDIRDAESRKQKLAYNNLNNYDPSDLNYNTNNTITGYSCDGPFVNQEAEENSKMQSPVRRGNGSHETYRSGFDAVRQSNVIPTLQQEAVDAHNKMLNTMENTASEREIEKLILQKLGYKSIDVFNDRAIIFGNPKIITINGTTFEVLAADSFTNRWYTEYYLQNQNQHCSQSEGQSQTAPGLLNLESDLPPSDLAQLALRLVSKLRKAQPSLRETFRYFDLEKDHRLCRDDFRQLLVHYGYNLTSNDREILFSFFDINNTSEITFQEFVQVVGEDDYPKNKLHDRGVW